MTLATGKTPYGGVYEHADGKRIIVNPKSGIKDVLVEEGGILIGAECKGGILNTRHSGQMSRLDIGLCEVVGRLMASEANGRQVAVVPYTDQTFKLATRLAPRCVKARIVIALAKSRGEIIDISPNALR